MVLPRIWVGCAASENAQQGVALAQRLTSDLRKAGAEVVSESFTLPDEQFLPFLQQELVGCQWFILVQTPQGMGSRRVQLAIQEALSRLRGGLLRGTCLVNASSNDWDAPPAWSEMKPYAYNGDYLRLRDKLLLDLGLLQITGLLEEEGRDTTVGMLPPVQEMPGFRQQTTGSAKIPVPFQERSGEQYKAPPFKERSGELYKAPPLAGLQQMGRMASKQGRETGRGDQPPPPPLSIPKLPEPSRRFWLYSAVSILGVLLLVSGVVLGRDMTLATSPALKTSVAVTHPTPTRPTPTRPVPTQAAPTQVPTQAAAPPPQAAPIQPPPGAVYSCGGLRSDGGASWTVTSGGLFSPPCESNNGYFSYTTTPTSVFALFFKDEPILAQGQAVDTWIYVPVSPYASADATYTLSFTCSSNASLPSATWQSIESQQQGWIMLSTYQLPTCSGGLSLTFEVSSNESDQAYLAEDVAALYFH